MPNTERTSYDVRSEKLKISQARNSSIGPEESLQQLSSDDRDVSDWIQNVRALKEKRKEEDYARNRQLEEDILRERKARQERRAIRSRSASPVKEVAQSAYQVNGSPAISPLLDSKEHLVEQLHTIVLKSVPTIARNSLDIDVPTNVDKKPQDGSPKPDLQKSIDAASQITSMHLHSSINSVSPQVESTNQQQGPRLGLTASSPSDARPNTAKRVSVLTESASGSPTLPTQGLRKINPNIAKLSSTFLSPKTICHETSEDLLSIARSTLRDSKVLRSPTSDSIRDTLSRAKTRLKSPTRSTNDLSLESTPSSLKTEQLPAPFASPRPLSAHGLVLNTRCPEENESNVSLPRINPKLAALLSQGPRKNKSASAAAASTTSQEFPASPSTVPVSGGANSLTHATRSRVRRAGVRPPKIESSSSAQSRLYENRSAEPRNTSARNTTRRDGPPLSVSSSLNTLNNHTAEMLKPLPTTLSNHQSTNSRVLSEAHGDFMKDSPMPVESKPQSATSVKCRLSGAGDSCADSSDKTILNSDNKMARSFSPFQKAADNRAKSSASKSTSSMSSFIEVVKSRAEASREQQSAEPLKLDNRLISKQSSHTAGHSAGFAHAWRFRGDQYLRITQEYNRLYSDEVLLLQANNTSTWFKWIGKDVKQDNQQQTAEIAGKSRVIDVHFGEESTEFMSLHGGLVVSIFANRGALLPSPKTPRIFSVRKYQSGFAIDEQSLDATSLCSGFVYLIVESLNYHVWIGKGSHSSEKEAAMQFVRELHSSIDGDKILGILEGNESIDFWASLGGKKKYASSSYWKLKPEFPTYQCDLYTLETNQRVVKHKVWSRESIQAYQHKVHIIDVFFEMYIILTDESNALPADILVAISWCKRFSLGIGRSRPFLPMVLILCPGSKLPRDLRACFREGIEDENRRLKVIEGSMGESLLKRNRFSLKELQSGTVLGIDVHRLDEHTAQNDFRALMGVTIDEFQALSEDERREVRDKAKQHLA